MSEEEEVLRAEGHERVVAELLEWVGGELRAGRDVVDAALSEATLREALARESASDHVVVRLASLLLLGLASHSLSHVRVRTTPAGAARIEVRREGEAWRPHPLLPPWVLARAALFRQVLWRLAQMAETEPGAPVAWGTCLLLVGDDGRLNCHIAVVRSPSADVLTVTHTPRADLAEDPALSPSQQAVADKALAYRERAEAALQARDVSAARAAFDAAIRTIATLGDVARGMHAHALLDAGMGLDWACREAEAEVYLLGALAILDANPRLTPSRTFDVLDALASVYEGLASEARLEGVLARREAFVVERFGRECLAWLSIRIERARLLADGGRPGEALDLLDEVEGAMVALFGEGISFAHVHFVRARAARLAGHVARARTEIERALALGRDEPCLFESGNISLEEGDPSGGAAQFRAILAELGARDMMWGPFAVEVQRSLARCLAVEDRPREAHALFEHAAGTLAKVRPAGHPRRVELDLELARSRLRLDPYR